MSTDSANQQFRVLPILLWQLVVAGCSGDPPEQPVTTPYVAVARGWISVEGGIRTIRAPWDGRIHEVLIHEGDTVKAGQILVTMDDAPLAIRLATSRAALAQAQAQADGLQARLPIAERDVTELREAAEAGAQAATLAEHAGVEAANLKAGIRAATAATEIARQNVRAAQLDFDARAVRSPVDGRVLRNSAHPGERINAESAEGLLQILPGGPRMIRAELAEEDLATVHVGSEAEVSTDSDTAGSYPARVVRIAGILGPPIKDSDATGSIDARAAECILTADKLPYLVGQRVIVRFRH